jgi:hypothetical protein
MENSTKILIAGIVSVPLGYAAYKLFLELWCIAYGLIY